MPNETLQVYRVQNPENLSCRRFISEIWEWREGTGFSWAAWTYVAFSSIEMYFCDCVWNRCVEVF